MKKIHEVYFEDIESVVINKYFMEQKMFDNNMITEKMELSAFIGKFMGLCQNNIVMIGVQESSQRVYPFYVYNELEDDIYVFYTNKSEDTDFITEKFKEIDFDFSKLKRYTDEDILININGKERTFV